MGLVDPSMDYFRSVTDGEGEAIQRQSAHVMINAARGN